MGTKRNNVNQLSKDVYEAQGDNDDDNDTTVVTNAFERADSSTLAKRRIFSRSSVGSSSGTSSGVINPFPSSQSPSTTTANPFVAVNLASATSTATASTKWSFSSGTYNNNNASSAPAERSTEPQKQPSFQFGSTNNTSSINNNEMNFGGMSAKPTFSFGSSNYASTTTMTETTTRSTGVGLQHGLTSPSEKEVELKYAKKSEEFDKLFKSSVVSCKSFADTDFTLLAESFLDHYRRLGSSFESYVNETGGEQKENNAPKTLTQTTASIIQSTITSPSTNPSFSFGVAPNLPPTSSASSASSNPTTSTTGMNLSLPWNSKFAEQQVFPKPNLVAAPPVEAANDDDGIDDKEPPTVVGAIQDPNWESIHLADKVRFYRLVDPGNPQKSSWISFALGKLDLQKEVKNPSSFRMVLRDDAMGKVQVNMRIAKNMMFNFSELKNKHGTVTGKISFSGINSAERGNEGFIIQAKKETAIRLHEKLLELSK